MIWLPVNIVVLAPASSAPASAMRSARSDWESVRMEPPIPTTCTLMTSILPPVTATATASELDHIKSWLTGRCRMTAGVEAGGCDGADTGTGTGHDGAGVVRPAGDGPATTGRP